MEVILHIGMGKTGTSSVQEALLRNRDTLKDSNFHYLGMWFDSISPDFFGIHGQKDFFNFTSDEMKRNACIFISALEKIEKDSGLNKFIISNEEMYAQVARFSPFVEELKKHVSVRIIAYVRDPREWLPSAYTQWSLVHKTYTGPIKSYGEFARTLVRTYSGFAAWHSSFSDILVVREFSRFTNVVDDFFYTLGLIKAEGHYPRALERIGQEEAILRYFFNNNIPSEALPSEFDKSVKGFSDRQTPRIRDIVENSLTYSETDSIVQENIGLFDFIRDKYAIDFCNRPPTHREFMDLKDIQERLNEHLLSIVMSQARRLNALEDQLSQIVAQRT